MDELLVAIQDAANTIAAPNWAAALSVIASFGAVVVAIAVALNQSKIAKEQNRITQKQTEIVQRQVEIAEQQNKIALFEKRYELYCIILKCINASQEFDVRYAKTNVMAQKNFLKELSDVPLKSLIPNRSIVNGEIMDIVNKLQEAEFLFPADVAKQILKFARSLYEVTFLDVPKDDQSGDFKYNLERFSQVVKKLLSDDFLEKIKKVLQLQLIENRR